MRWLDQCREWVRRYDPVKPEMLEGAFHHYGAVRRLSEMLPADAIMVYDTGGNAIMSGHCFKSKRGQRIFSSNANSAMGFAMCGAIGAWFAQPTRPIICLIGDGGMQLNLQELQTIAFNKIPVKIFILNNLILANTLLYQIQNNKARIGCNPEGGYAAPNFRAIASAYGIENYGLGEWDRFDYVVNKALASDGPVIVDVVHANFCNFAPRITLWNGGVEEMFPPLPEAEFEANMTVPPVDGWRERRKLYKEIK